MGLHKCHSTDVSSISKLRTTKKLGSHISGSMYEILLM